MSAAVHPKTLSASAIAVIISLMIIPASFFVPEPGAPGFSLFLCWTGFCIGAVLADRMLIWALLNVGPLTLLAAYYYWALRGISNDPFGEVYTVPGAFLMASFVTAGTGVLSIVRTAAKAKAWQSHG